VTLDRISKKFFSLLLPEITANAQLLSEKLEAEDGVGNALSSFYRHLHIENMICDISIFFGEAQLAHVWCPQCGFKMTREVSECIHNPPPAMATAATAGGTGAKVHEEEMRSHQIVPCTYVNWSLNRGPTTASEGVIQGLGGATHELVAGLTDTVLEPIHAIFKGNGLTGAMEGVVQGLRGFIISPISGGQILLSKVSEGFKNSLSQPTLPDPNHRFTRDGSIRRPDGSVYGNPFAEEFSTSLHPHSQPPVGPPTGPRSDSPVTAEVPMSSTSLSQSGLSIQSKISRGLEHSIPLEMSCVLSPQPQLQSLPPLSPSTCTSPDQQDSLCLGATAEVTPDVIELDHVLQRTLRNMSPPLDSEHLGEATPSSFSSTDSHSDLPQMNFHAAVLEEHNQQQQSDDPDDEGEIHGEAEGAFFCAEEEERGKGCEQGRQLGEVMDDMMLGSQTPEVAAFFAQLKLDNEVSPHPHPCPLPDSLSPSHWSPQGTRHLSIILIASGECLLYPAPHHSLQRASLTSLVIPSNSLWKKKWKT
jgi:hypothetical protein